MNEFLYPMIYKRKSFHVFKEYKSFTKEELEDIKSIFYQCTPLIKDIKVEMKIVEKSETTCKRGEYCILLYSEEKEHYLKNIGYIGEQLDLWLAKKNIGVCWYGAGKMKKQYDMDLKFVIMLAIQKVPEHQFRKDMFRSKRKPVEEIWHGEDIGFIANIVRFAPSACNLQPWLIESENKNLHVYKIISTKRGIMPADKVDNYSEMDMGIFLCFLEICMQENKLLFQRELCHTAMEQRVLCAKYRIL